MPTALPFLGAPDVAATAQGCLIPGFPSRWSINYARLVLMVPGPGLSVPPVSPTPQGWLQWHCQLCPPQPLQPHRTCKPCTKGPRQQFSSENTKSQGKNSAEQELCVTGHPGQPWGCSSQLGPSLWAGFCAKTLPGFGSDGKRNSPFPPNDFQLQPAHCP